MFNSFKIIDNFPRNLNKMELKLYKMGYRLFKEKIDNGIRIRSYYRGNKWIRLKDIINDSIKLPENA